MGVRNTADALVLAREIDLDLVEVAPFSPYAWFLGRRTQSESHLAVPWTRDGTPRVRFPNS